MSQYDVAVIGGGAAGLSAALVLSRALRKVVVIDAGTPRNAPASHMHGYLSRDGMPPGELLAIGRNEVRSYGGEITPGAVRYALIVGQWTHDVLHFTPPDTLSDADRSQLTARAIGVVEGTIEQLVINNDTLRGVQLDDGCVVPRDALFVAPRLVP